MRRVSEWHADKRNARSQIQGGLAGNSTEPEPQNVQTLINVMNFKFLNKTFYWIIIWTGYPKKKLLNYWYAGMGVI